MVGAIDVPGEEFSSMIIATSVGRLPELLGGGGGWLLGVGVWAGLSSMTASKLMSSRGVAVGCRRRSVRDGWMGLGFVVLMLV